MTAPRRARCERCLRPLTVCYCAHLPRLETRTHVLLLQHPREHRMPVGTARMAHLALPNSALRVGIGFDEDRVVDEALRGRAVLLYPGPDARDIEALRSEEPVTLVVLDGTWWQTRKLLQHNPRLLTLPRVQLAPTRPSAYRIRRQPAAHCISTIEALAQSLSSLEPDGARFEALLAPFHAMVDTQVRFVTEVHAGRQRHAVARARRAARARRLPLTEALRRDWERLVVVQGDANAWPARTPDRPAPALVHWVALRPASGERFEVVIAPRGPLAPSTVKHVALAEERLRAGVSEEEARARWQAFLRPGDVGAAWGRYYANLAEAEGLTIPAPMHDLRAVLAERRRQRTGTVEEAAAVLELAAEVAGEGRAQRRLAQAAAVAGWLRGEG